MRTSAIERASGADLAYLAMDRHGVPEQFAVVLVLDEAVDPADAGRLLEERIAAVPRLRRRLVRRHGRAGWAEDERFDVHRHLFDVPCRWPGDEAALLRTVLPLVTEPLPRDRPLWRAAFVGTLPGGGCALVLVVHHVLADGLGGLALLERLVDAPPAQPAPAPARSGMPADADGPVHPATLAHRTVPSGPATPAESMRPAEPATPAETMKSAGPAASADSGSSAPDGRSDEGAAAGRARADVLRAALRARLVSAGRVKVRWRAAWATASAGGGIAPARAADSSLLAPTGSRREAVTVRIARHELAGWAHPRGATVNDALLVGVAAALRRVLEQRGERLDEIVAAVPVAAGAATGDQPTDRTDDGGAKTRSTKTGRPGNSVAPLLVRIPASGPATARLRAVAVAVHARRALATGPAPITALGGLFRAAAVVGAYHGYMAHQHRAHTVVSHVRGPQRPVRFAGVPVRDMIPLGVGDTGNMTVVFQVLSYAGTLRMTATADADHWPDLAKLSEALEDELTSYPMHSSAWPA